jgi:tRNA threonylcarbamoyladenosine biosynthesis protein TsaE
LEILVHTLHDLSSASQTFLEHFGHNKIFAFHAEMGTGKTTFINSLLNAMGIEETEGSPTYSLVNVYQSPMFGKVYHMDVYRLKSEEEAMDFGVEEMLYGGGICFIEWPEKIEGLLPENTVHIYMDKMADGSRKIKIDL